MTTGTISGTVYERSDDKTRYTVGAYSVRLYKRSDGSLVAKTTCSATGSYSLTDIPITDGQDDPIEYFLVAVDNAATWKMPGLVEGVFPT